MSTRDHEWSWRRLPSAPHLRFGPDKQDHRAHHIADHTPPDRRTGRHTHPLRAQCGGVLGLNGHTWGNVEQRRGLQRARADQQRRTSETKVIWVAIN